PQPVQKDEYADDRRRDAGHEDGRGGDVERFPAARLSAFVEAVEERFHRAVEQLGREHHADAKEQNNPVLDRATQHRGGGEKEGGDEEGHAEARLALDAEWEGAESVGEVATPAARRLARRGCRQRW